jgi:ribosome-binding factor A
VSRKRMLPRARGSRRGESCSSFGEAERGGAGHRGARLEAVLLEQVQSILRDEAADPVLAGLRLLSLELSADGAHARVGVALAGARASERRAGREAQAALARAEGFLRALLAGRLQLKRLPRFSFVVVGVFERDPGHSADPGGAPWPA